MGDHDALVVERHLRRAVDLLRSPGVRPELIPAMLAIFVAAEHMRQDPAFALLLEQDQQRRSGRTQPNFIADRVLESAGLEALTEETLLLRSIWSNLATDRLQDVARDLLLATPHRPELLAEILLDTRMAMAKYGDGLRAPIVDLLTQLLPDGHHQQILCGHTGTAQVALRLAADQRRQVTLEQGDAATSIICGVLARAFRLPLTVVHRLQPSYLSAPGDIDDAGEAQPRYDVVLLAPPFNAKLDDKIGRASDLPAGATMEMAAISYAARVAHRLGMIIVANGILLRTTKADSFFKEEAVQRFGLGVVVGLPGRPFLSTSIAGSLVLVEPDMRWQDVLMVRAPDLEQVASSDINAPAIDDKALAARSLLNDILWRQEGDYSRLVPLNELADNDYNLLPDRYVLSPELAAAQRRLADVKTVRLDDVCEIIRTQAIADRQDASFDGDKFHELREVSASDLDEVGLVLRPAKVLQVADTVYRRARPPLLRQGDVVIAIKGSAGRTGYVRKIPEGELWVTNQSFVILRPRGGAIEPLVLYRYLSSDLGQAMLTRYVSGTTVPGIAIADLRRLPVPLPPADLSRHIVEQAERLLHGAAAVHQLRAAVATMRREAWPDGDLVAVPPATAAPPSAPLRDRDGEPIRRLDLD